MIGGTSRDYLLGLPVADFDLVTDATPAQMETFLTEADYRFAHYGNVKLKVDAYHVDITTLREEAGYKDYRHPQSIHFVTDIEKDYPRRDFTVNAIYIDSELQIHDFAFGHDHLRAKRLVMIGEPNARLQEDPLRILRALRFCLRLGFTLDEPLQRAIVNNVDMLEYLTGAKVNDEIAKMERVDTQGAKALLQSYGIKERY